MIEKIIFIAEDGREFETKEECLKYEQELETYKLADALGDFCATSRCPDCLFWREGECFFVNNSKTPAEWNFE